jgi:hypothetical protein
MLLLLSIAATILVALFAYRVANKRLQYRHNALQLEILTSFTLSTLFGQLLAVDALRDGRAATALLRMAGFVAMFNMLVAASRFMRALRQA